MKVTHTFSSAGGKPNNVRLRLGAKHVRSACVLRSLLKTQTAKQNVGTPPAVARIRSRKNIQAVGSLDDRKLSQHAMQALGFHPSGQSVAA